LIGVFHCINTASKLIERNQKKKFHLSNFKKSSFIKLVLSYCKSNIYVVWDKNKKMKDIKKKWKI